MNRRAAARPILLKIPRMARQNKDGSVSQVAHDLDHVTQIARVMARQYADEVGPWRDYLRVISGRQG